MASKPSGLKKNLPKRCISEKLKDRRKRSWERGQQRKEKRRQANQAAYQRNQRLRSQGLPTPWEEACARAQQRRTSHRGAT